MIETNYYILDAEDYQEHYMEAKELGVSIDYYLDEFTIVEGPKLEWNGIEWVEI